MKYPSKLFQNYRAIKNCGLIKTKIVSEENLNEFEDLLNASQPCLDNDSDESIKYNSMKEFYLLNKHKFIDLIRNTKLECLILWTESKSIINWFHLSGIVYLSYNYESKLYSIQEHRNINKNLTSDLNTAPQKNDIGVNNYPILNNAFSSLTVDEDEILFKNKN
jgi:hypothetical protein